MLRCGRTDLARKQAVVALLLACAFCVQVLLAGVALAGAAPSKEAVFSRNCATSTNSSTTEHYPLAPGGHSHVHGFCCILHTAVVGLAPQEDVGDRRRLRRMSNLRRAVRIRLLRERRRNLSRSRRAVLRPSNSRPLLQERPALLRQRQEADFRGV